MTRGSEDEDGRSTYTVRYTIIDDVLELLLLVEAVHRVVRGSNTDRIMID